MKLRILLPIVTLLIAACTSTPVSKAERRQEIQSMATQTLAKLYRIRPGAKDMVANAPGYAVFSNAQVNLLIASVGGGYGLVKGKSGTTYMKMGELGLGLGLGVKDFRAVFVFLTQDAMTQFVESGWSFGGEADATAKASQQGGGAEASANFGDIKVFQITESGLALQLTIKGAKFWKDDALN